MKSKKKTNKSKNKSKKIKSNYSTSEEIKQVNELIEYEKMNLVGRFCYKIRKFFQK